MNSEQRAALVEDIHDTLRKEYGHRWHVDPMGVVNTIMPIIDRVLTTRAAPEPDDDADVVWQVPEHEWTSESVEELRENAGEPSDPATSQEIVDLIHDVEIAIRASAGYPGIAVWLLAEMLLVAKQKAAAGSDAAESEPGDGWDFGSDHHQSLIAAVWRGLESSQASRFSNSGIAHRIADNVELWLQERKPVQSDWLDEILDQLPPRAWLNVQTGDGESVAVIQMPGELGRANRYISGTGATRREAVLDVVAAAQEGRPR